MDRQTDRVSLAADIGTRLGGHHAAAREVVRVLETDEAGRGLIVGNVDLQNGFDLVPREMSRAVAAFDRTNDGLFVQAPENSLI